MITASMKTCRRWMSSFSMTRTRFRKSHWLATTTSEFVALSGEIFTSPWNSSAAVTPGTPPRGRPAPEAGRGCCGGGPPARAARPVRRALRQRLQRRGDVLGVGVLERVDVDPPLAADGDVDLLEQRVDALVRRRGGHDDQLVGALVGDEGGDASPVRRCRACRDWAAPRRARGRARRRLGPGVGVTVSRGRAPGRFALASNSFWMVWPGPGVRVPDLDDPHLVGAGAAVQLLDDPLEAVHVRADVVDDQRVRLEGDGVAVLADQLLHHAPQRLEVRRSGP